MPLPGVVLIRGEVAPPRSAPTDTGVLFLVASAATGPTEPRLVESIAQVVDLYGDRDPASLLYDALDVYFREGGSRAYVVRQDDPLDAGLTAALDRISRDLGPGQIVAPGRTTAAAHAALLAHADANNRVALLDGPDTATVADVTAAAAAARAATGNRVGSLWAPWAVVPGVAGGTTRTVPWSAVQAGIIARNDGAGATANAPSAGDLGQSRFALALSRTYTDADRQTLHDAGVNLARSVHGSIRAYGYRTLVAEGTDPNFVGFGNSRLYMALQAELEAVAERFVFRQIDGQGRVLAEFEGALMGTLVPYYNAGALYGDQAGDAFVVDVGPSINTLDRLAAGELRAIVAVRMSPFAERVVIELVKVATQEAL